MKTQCEWGSERIGGGQSSERCPNPRAHTVHLHLNDITSDFELCVEHVEFLRVHVPEK